MLNWATSDDTGCPGRIDHHRRVMNDLRIRRPKFPGFDVSPPRDGNRHDEVSQAIAATGRYSIRHRQRDDDVGTPELPSVVGRGHRRKRSQITCTCATLEPMFEHGNLFVGQPPFVGELCVARLRFPRRHRPALHRGDDLARPAFDVGIREQTEWRRSARAMARCAVRGDQGRDVVRECQFFGVGGSRASECQGERRHRHDRAGVHRPRDISPAVCSTFPESQFFAAAATGANSSSESRA